MARPAIGMRLRDAKAGFFDSDLVKARVDKATRQVLSKFGAFTRTAAIRSIRPIGQKSLGELTPQERRAFRIRQEIAKRQGFKASRPLRHSRPGEPPKSISGLLRKFIYFSYDAQRRSVVIGPAKLNTKSQAPATLEYGGNVAKRRGGQVHIEPRPYMEPAYNATKADKLDTLWKNSVR